MSESLTFTAPNIPEELISRFVEKGFKPYVYEGQEGVFLRKEFTYRELGHTNPFFDDYGEAISLDDHCVIEIIPADGNIQVSYGGTLEFDRYSIGEEGWRTLAKSGGVEVGDLLPETTA